MIKSARWLWTVAAGLVVSTAAVADPAGSGAVADPAPGAANQDAGAPLAEPGSAAAAPDASNAARGRLELSYNHGIEMTTEDGQFRLRLGVRSQLRFESTRPTEDGAEFANRFYIARSRLGLDGNAFGEANRYKLEFSLDDRGSFGYLKDIYIDRAAGPVQVRFGQWKRPFNRQEIVSDFASQFNERANTADFVGGGRDVGVAIHNGYERSPAGVEWVLGVFNGFSGGSDRPALATTCSQGAAAISCTTPAPTNVPADWGPTVVARVGWNSPGIKGYSESDLEGGPLRYAVAASYKIDLANFSRGRQSSKLDNTSHGAEIDAMVKLEGFSLELGGYLMKIKSADASYGALAQAGMFVIPQRAEVAARFAVAPTTGDRDQIEARGAFNWFWDGHRWKWATDVGFVVQTGRDPMTMATDRPDYQLRTMAQLTF